MIDVDADLTKILDDLKSSLTLQQVKLAFAATDREMREDIKAHGGSAEDAFWDVISDERTHVFSVFGADMLDLYAFSTIDFQELLGKLNFLAMADVEELKELLITSYGIEAPQISIDRSHAEQWLGG